MEKTISFQKIQNFREKKIFATAKKISKKKSQQEKTLMMNYGQFKPASVLGAPNVPAGWNQQVSGQIVNPTGGVGTAVALGNGTVVQSYPTLAAAGPAISQGCPIPATDMTTMVPKQVVQKHQQMVVWYTVKTEQHPVTTATAVQVVSHPTICGALPQADVCAPAVANPCGTGACGVGAAVASSYLPSSILPGGSVSQTRINF